MEAKGSVLTVSEEAELYQLEREIARLSSVVISSEQEEELVRCRDDEWYWMQTYLWTLDDKDRDEPEKRYPDWPVLHDMVRVWQSYPLIRLIVYEKSRRQLCTLTHAALLLHDTMFYDGRLNFIVSQNEEKAAVQIERRCAYMYSKLPQWMKDAYPAKPTYTQMVFPGKDKNEKLRKEATSKIWSVPQRGEQIRGETPSNVLFDEVVAQSEAESNYSALAPALEPGNEIGPRFVAVSTAGIGFFDRLVHDFI